MNTKPTNEELAKLEEETGMLKARIRKGEILCLQGSYEGWDWHDICSKPGFNWPFLRLAKTPQELEDEAHLAENEAVLVVCDGDATKAEWRERGKTQWNKQATWNGIEKPYLEFRIRPDPAALALEQRKAENECVRLEWEASGRKKVVQYLNHSFHSTWIDWDGWNDEPPRWTATHLSFRIKSDPKYVPYTFEDRLKLASVALIAKSSGSCLTVLAVSERLVDIRGVQYTYPDILTRFTHLDGTPCGKLEEEGK